MKPPLERSDDPFRGHMPHLRAVIETLSTLKGRRCEVCDSGMATHLIDVRMTPRGVCERCARDWRVASPIDRLHATTEFRRRR